MQTIATFFSHVMNAIGGNIAGPGRWSFDVLRYNVMCISFHLIKLNATVNLR